MNFYSQTKFMRRFHFTIALAATLTGCTCIPPQHVSRTDSRTVARPGKAVVVKKERLRHRNTKTAALPVTMKAPPHPDDKSSAESKNSVATKVETPQPSQSEGRSNVEPNMKSIVANTEPSQSPQLDDETVIKKARVAIAARMDDPVSVVFLDMKRAARKDALGNSIDTICGRVRGKLAGDTADRPFLYIVQKDAAYVGAYALATAEYRNICN